MPAMLMTILDYYCNEALLCNHCKEGHRQQFPNPPIVIEVKSRTISTYLWLPRSISKCSPQALQFLK